MAEKNKKLVIIGAGPGGYAAAFHAADLGLEVTLIDPEVNPGGVCLYRGCIPSKALLHAAKVKQEAMEASNFGITFEEPKIDAKKILEWKNSVVKKLTDGLGQLSKGKNITYIQGKASFGSEKTVDIENANGDTSSLEFEHIIIATGSAVVSLPGVDIDHKVVIDSTDALDIKDIPNTMLIIGGGYIGLEIGSVYAHLGTKVSIAEMTPGYLPGADPELVKVFEAENQDLFDGVYFETSVDEVAVNNGKAKVTLKNKDEAQKKEFEKVMVAIGRKPDTEKLQLDKAGVETDDKGFIKVDQQRKTNIEHIYAIGDVTGEPMLAHKATHEGRIAVEVIAGKKGAAYDPKAIPAIVFTNPELAWCGLTVAQAEEEDIPYEAVKFPWSASGRAATLGVKKGLTKLLIDPETKIILGGAVAGKNAGALIPEIALAIEMAATAEDLSLTIHPHPTLSETVMEAAELFLGSPTHMAAKK